MKTSHEIPEGTIIRVVHLHPGNSRKRDRKGSKYMTIAKLIGGTKEKPVELARGIARCNENDEPSRKVGRECAIGRALKAQQMGLRQYPEPRLPERLPLSFDEMVATVREEVYKRPRHPAKELPNRASFMGGY